MPTNLQLIRAKVDKKDEFFTPIELIEEELKHYSSQLIGKIIYCNCDDPNHSEFVNYFSNNFRRLALSKLIATGLNGTKLEVTKNGWKLSQLKSGDFKSEECLDLLKESDIVVTNPPFSLFREFLKILVDHDKQFLILGNINSITSGDVFRMIREKKMWFGESIHSGDRKFYVNDDYPLNAVGCGEEDGKKFINVKGVRWFTNIGTNKSSHKLELIKNYNPNEYPTFDNYSVINCDKTKDIPNDYFGPIGVPITFLDKWDSEQFEILDANDFRKNSKIPKKPHGLIKDKEAAINGKPTYVRLVIRKLTEQN